MPTTITTTIQTSNPTKILTIITTTITNRYSGEPIISDKKHTSYLSIGDIIGIYNTYEFSFYIGI